MTATEKRKNIQARINSIRDQQARCTDESQRHIWEDLSAEEGRLLRTLTALPA